MSSTERVQRLRARNRQIQEEYKKGHPCARCGESYDPRGMVLRPAGNKVASVMLNAGVKRHQEWLEGCTVYCGTCDLILEATGDSQAADQ